MTLIIDTKKTITSIQKKILPNCEELFFQVGYFYFSGFEEIYKYLKTKKIKIIIGMAYDEKISELATSSTGIKERYFKVLQNSEHGFYFIWKHFVEKQGLTILLNIK